MNTYTIQELNDLRLYINSNISWKNVYTDSEYEICDAMLTISGIVSNYSNPETIYKKTLEFADLSEPHRIIFNLIYFKTLEELIPYLNTEFEPIVVWRCSLENKQA
jgi:hypothetical protein